MFGHRKILGLYKLDRAWQVAKRYNAAYTKSQGWVMRPFAQTNARMIRTIRVFNFNASAFRGHF